MALSEATIALVKYDYEETDLTIITIGKKHGCSTSYICRLARNRGWLLRSIRLGRTPRTPVAVSEAARAGIAQRLCSLINKKLDQMEKDMESGALGSSDLERDTKSVGAMMSGMDKVMAPADADTKQKTKDAAAQEADAGLDEVARLQREIVERFERIERRREAARGSE
jgi:hypothetical protein